MSFPIALPKAPLVSWQTRIVAALVLVVLGELYYVSRLTQNISDFTDFARNTCAVLNERTIAATGYYSDGVKIYGDFATGWRKHGYSDIAADWEALATRDRLRVDQLSQDQTVRECGRINISTPPPIKFLPLNSAPPAVAPIAPKGTP